MTEPTEPIAPGTVDELPPAPVRGTDGVFRQIAVAFVLSLAKFRAQLVALGQNVYDNALKAFNFAMACGQAVVDATAQALRAESAATAAAALANFQGPWPSLSDSLSTPASVSNSGAIWLLNTDLEDVTLSEPTEDNTDWVRFTLFEPSVALSDPTVLFGFEVDYLRSVDIPAVGATLYAAKRVSDGKGYAIAVTWGEAPVLSNLCEFESNFTAQIDLSVFPGTSTVAASYEGLDYDGYVCALNLENSTTLSLVTTYEFKDATTVTGTCCEAIASGLLFVGYTFSGALYGQVLNYSGVAFTLNTAETLLRSGSDIDNLCSALLSGGSTARIAITTGSRLELLYIFFSGAALTMEDNPTVYGTTGRPMPVISPDPNSIVVFNYLQGRGPALYCFYHAGGSTDDFELVGAVEFAPIAYSYGLTPDSLIDLGSGKIAALTYKSINSYNYFKLFVLDVVVSSTIAETLVELVFSQQINRNGGAGGAESCINKTGPNQIQIAYSDADNSKYITTEKIKITGI